MRVTEKKQKKKDWLIPIGLVLLSLVPMAAGATRIVELSSGTEITPENARFFASPIPVVAHIITSIIYSIVGAFQFSSTFRHSRPKWHRRLGWLLVPSGLVVALSGLWMTMFYPWPEGDGELLFGMRILFGSMMVFSIVLGVLAIPKRDYLEHGAWMMRGYAIGLGAGTQVLTHIPWFVLFGTPDEFTRALLMGAGWVINLAVAEWAIRKRRSQRNQRRRPSSAST